MHQLRGLLQEPEARGLREPLVHLNVHPDPTFGLHVLDPMNNIGSNLTLIQQDETEVGTQLLDVHDLIVTLTGGADKVCQCGT